MIQFYGAPMSSAGRAHLMLEEIGVPYEYHRINLRDDAAKAAYRKLNPIGRVPFLVDGDVQLSESCAINFYLAEKYKPEWMPGRLEDRARVYMWSFWAMTNLQPEALAVMFAAMTPNDPHPELPKKTAAVQKLVDELEAGIDGYLVGKQFSVADVIAGSVVNLVSRVNAATLGPRTTSWLDGLRARDAWKRVAAQS
jgi:glutathione S-transferase